MPRIVRQALLITPLLVTFAPGCMPDATYSRASGDLAKAETTGDAADRLDMADQRDSADGLTTSPKRSDGSAVAPSLAEGDDESKAVEQSSTADDVASETEFESSVGGLSDDNDTATEADDATTDDTTTDDAVGDALNDATVNEADDREDDVEMNEPSSEPAADAEPDIEPENTEPAPAACEGNNLPQASGATIELGPNGDIGETLGQMNAGDRLLLAGGNYGNQTIARTSFGDFIFIEAAEGESVVFNGLTFLESDHIVLDGVSVEGTLELRGASDLVLSNLIVDGGGGDDAAILFQGQESAGANHDIRVVDSIIGGGGRTVFVLGRFDDSETWNHHIEFRNNQISCGDSVGFQLSGARDFLIEGNDITSGGSNAILTAGATRVTISRNRFRGSGGAAMQLATPGAEWDNYAGVENMISSDIIVVNNILDGWNTGVQFDAATEVSIVNNTFVDGSALRFNHRMPRDQNDNLILDGNTEIRVWNNIMSSMSVGDQGRPVFESSNLVSGSGGGGDGLISTEPLFEDGSDFALSATSPAVDAAVLVEATPLMDFDGATRGDKPDIGAREQGAASAGCP